MRPNLRPPGHWLRPPRTLLLALVAITVVAVSAVGWFGRSLLEQERVIESQRVQERQEQAADRIAADAREALAETGERLGAWILAPGLNQDSGKAPAEGVVVVVNGRALSATPVQRLLYRPEGLDTPVSEAADDVFAEGEALEFEQRQPVQAVPFYERLAEKKDPAIRAGALMRLARALRKTGREDDARAAYAKLAVISDARVAGAPADLVGLAALNETAAIHEGLANARWSLSRGQFEFYWSQAWREPLPAEFGSLSEVFVQGWGELARDQSASGQQVAWLGNKPYLLIWRGLPEHRAILVTRPESLFRQIFSRDGLSPALVDAEGRVVLGARGLHATVRTPVESRLPWTLYVTSTPGAADAGLIARQRFLLLVTTIMALILVAGAYFIARAIRTEAATSRMQSDFVSAVSHEFRSPLTSMRQLSEMLVLGRVPDEARRQLYYETLVRETTRLQRLVEGLLNFGRMEAGAGRFRFEETDAVRLMENVAAEFEPQVAASGRRIEIGRTGESCAGQSCTIEADPEALTVALRNLVDNALKYAPKSPTIWMECGVEDNRVAIRVRDEGPGIPRAERRAIFRKFVRGSAAAAANVKGSGVGLAMVRDIVTLHRGDIRVTSEAGLGSTFTILLPRGVRA